MKKLLLFVSIIFNLPGYIAMNEGEDETMNKQFFEAVEAK